MSDPVEEFPKKPFVFGFYVEVEAWGVDAGDAANVAEYATGFPGDRPWFFGEEALLRCHGEITGKSVEATIVKSTLLNHKPIEKTTAERLRERFADD